MQKTTLDRILKGMRATHKTAVISARRWLNSYIVTVDFPGADGVAEYVFSDHEYMHGDNPVGMLVDTICSLPWQQQIPLICLMGDLIKRENTSNAVTEQLGSALQDLKLEILALRHDNESLKREKAYLLRKYEGHNG